MAVYGDQLAFFPELFIMLENYEAKPLSVSGKEERVLVQKFRGVIQDLKSGELVENGDTLNATAVPTLWTRTKLRQGSFVVNPAEPDLLYIVNKPNDYKFQGNFIVYVLNLVCGDTDRQENNEDFSYGLDGYN